jgi:hypothetical protein
MEKQLSCARVRRYAEYNGLQSSATSDNVCFPRTMGLGLSLRFGNCSLHSCIHSCLLEYCQRVAYWLLKRKCVSVSLLKFHLDALNRAVHSSYGCHGLPRFETFCFITLSETRIQWRSENIAWWDVSNFNSPMPCHVAGGVSSQRPRF